MKENRIEDILKKTKNATSDFKVWVKASPNTIRLYETAFGVILPDEFKEFLKITNGLDEIVLTEEAKHLWQQGEYEEARMLGSKILSVEEVFEEYEDLSINDWKLPSDYTGFYPYIPFCITQDNEKLVFVNQLLKKEPAIFYAYHDEPASAWIAVAKNFTEFLSFYIDSKGKIPADEVDKKLCAEDFLKTIDVDKLKKKVDDPKEVIKRDSAYLELFPKDSLTCITRANAYTDLMEYEKALHDFNRALDLEPKSAFAYSCRGSMFFKIKKYRSALTDFDSACYLEPYDAYNLARRAETFYELNKMDKALADCNQAIEIDDRLSMAYMTRYNIYLYQGEAEKAEADSKIINELLNEN